MQQFEDTRTALIASLSQGAGSSTVKDLVAGSGIGFREHGFVELKGVPGEWRLYSVENGSAE